MGIEAETISANRIHDKYFCLNNELYIFHIKVEILACFLKIILANIIFTFFTAVFSKFAASFHSIYRPIIANIFPISFKKFIQGNFI